MTNCPKPGAGVTLAEVAKAAGVGESTASRVLRRHGSFSEKARARVMAAVDALGYVPNRIAGTLASSGTQLVAVVIPSLSNIVFPDVLRGIAAGLEPSGHQSVIGVSEYDLGREETLIASMLAWRPAGILVAGVEHTAAARRMLQAGAARVAELLDIDGPGIDIVVGFSNRAAGQASARHLLARGYRRIGYVGHDFGLDRRAGKRFAGFCAVLAEAGLALADLERLPGISSVEAGKTGLERLLDRSPRIDAVYFSNDDMAIGGYFHCLARGIAIPERVALFGYNGLALAAMAPQPLASIRTPRVDIGRIAAERVLADGPPEVIDLGFELIEGATA